MTSDIAIPPEPRAQSLISLNTLSKATVMERARALYPRRAALCVSLATILLSLATILGTGAVVGYSTTHPEGEAAE